MSKSSRNLLKVKLTLYLLLCLSNPILVEILASVYEDANNMRKTRKHVEDATYEAKEAEKLRSRLNKVFLCKKILKAPK